MLSRFMLGVSEESDVVFCKSRCGTFQIEDVIYPIFSGMSHNSVNLIDDVSDEELERRF